MPMSLRLSQQQIGELSALTNAARALGAIKARVNFYDHLGRAIRNLVVDRGTGPVAAAVVMLIRPAGLLPSDQLGSMARWCKGPRRRAAAETKLVLTGAA